MRQFAGIFFICLFLFLSHLSAQEIGIEIFSAKSDARDFSRPYGGMLFTSLPISDRLSGVLRIGIGINTRDYTGVLQGGFFPTPPVMANIHSSTLISTVEAGIQIRLLRIWGLGIHGSLGLTIDRFNLQRTNRDSKENKIFTTIYKTGPLASVFIKYAFERLFSGALIAGVRWKTLAGGNTTTDMEEPFMGNISTRFFFMGLTYRFSAW